MAYRPATTPASVARDEAGLESVPNPFARVSWGAIFAGLVLVMALTAVLNLLGIGIGLTTVRPSSGDNPSAEALTRGALMWWVVVTWIALVCGGYVASRLAGSYVDQDGMLHGLIVWAAALVVSVFAVTAAAGIGGLTLGSAVAKVLGGAAKGVSGQATDQMTSVRGGGQDQFTDLRTAANFLLRPANPNDLSNEAATAELAAGLAALVTGKGNVDRDRLAAIISAKAGIPKDEAAKRLADWEQSARQARAEAEAKAREAADAAVRVARQTAIWGFVVIILGAVAAAGGGRLGVLHASAARTAAYDPRLAR